MEWKRRARKLGLAALVIVGLIFGQSWVVTCQPVIDLGVILIFDVSGSMDDLLGSQKKIDVARTQLYGLLARFNLPIALRVFGSGLEDCTSALKVPFNAPKGTIQSEVAKLTASGMTPIAETLRDADTDFRNANVRERRIIYIGDGDETCGGNPAAVAAGLIAAGVDITIYAVGFGIDADGRGLLQTITSSTGGTYYEATNGQELNQGIYGALTDIVVKAGAEGWVELSTNASVDVRVYVEGGYAGTLSPGGILRFTAPPGEVEVMVLDTQQRPKYKLWKEKITVTKGEVTTKDVILQETQ